MPDPVYVCHQHRTAGAPCYRCINNGHPAPTEGWHPDPQGTDALNELLKDELDACRDEIARLRAQNKLLLALGEDRDVQTFGCGVYRVVVK